MSVLSDKRELHLLVLDILCLRELGPEFITYEPETLFAEMRERFGPLGRVTSEKLLACQVLHSNNSYWTEWEAFEKVTASISGEVAIFSYVQPPDPEEAAISHSSSQTTSTAKKCCDTSPRLACRRDSSTWKGRSPSHFPTQKSTSLTRGLS